jgi:hypothetical protein
MKHWIENKSNREDRIIVDPLILGWMGYPCSRLSVDVIVGF